MKKFHIYWAGFENNIGGAYRHVVSLSQGLAALGLDVEVISLSKIPVPLCFLPHLFQIVGNTFFFPLGFLWKQKVIKILFKTFFARGSEIDIFEDVYLYWPSRKPSLVMLHALWSDNLQAFYTDETRRRNLERKETEIINQIKATVATVSYPYRDFLLGRLRELGLQKSIEVIELGIDLNRFQEENHGKTKSIVFVGVLEARKNVKFLLDVFARLKSLDDQYSLTIVGDGRQRGELMEYCRMKGVEGVCFKGRLPAEAVASELSKHCIYVHTSLKESFSYSLLEAKVAGLTTVALGALEVPSVFIDIKMQTFDVEEWVYKIQHTQTIEISEFPKERYSEKSMVLRTLSSVTGCT